MVSRFRHVDNYIFDAVTLHLFTTSDGIAQGDVAGPRRIELSGICLGIVERVSRATLACAFAAAIRIANRNDAEIVVTGDAGLWDSSWGQLVDHTTVGRARAATLRLASGSA